MADPSLLADIDPQLAPDSPCWLLDVDALERNLLLLGRVQREAQCKVLLALKGFATWSVFDQVDRHLSGASVSSPHEAMLAHEHFQGELHAYAPAYSEQDLETLLPRCDHLIFNSLSQWRRHRARLQGLDVEVGLRVNPEHSEVAVPLYDPCAPGCRLGVRAQELQNVSLEGIDGLHFHTLCEMGVAPLQRTLKVVEDRFAAMLKKVRWVNFGGGHHITSPGYDVAALVNLIRDFRQRHDVEVYLEPSEAIAVGTGVLITTVLDIIPGDPPCVILDCSVTAHLGDVIEMPFRPEVRGARLSGEHPHSYRLGGLTCLAGDVLGDYSFAEPLQVGQRLSILDTAHYTTVKTNNFNGVQLPSLALYKPSRGTVTLLRRFGYESYRDRLS